MIHIVTVVVARTSTRVRSKDEEDKRGRRKLWWWRQMMGFFQKYITDWLCHCTLHVGKFMNVDRSHLLKMFSQPLVRDDMLRPQLCLIFEHRQKREILGMISVTWSIYTYGIDWTHVMCCPIWQPVYPPHIRQGIEIGSLTASHLVLGLERCNIIIFRVDAAAAHGGSHGAPVWRHSALSGNNGKGKANCYQNNSSTDCQHIVWEWVRERRSIEIWVGKGTLDGLSGWALPQTLELFVCLCHTSRHVHCKMSIRGLSSDR